jgi:hypothetical protein
MSDLKWQPIETAPKDGTWVLLGWWTDDQEWQMAFAHWYEEFEQLDLKDDTRCKRGYRPIYRAAWTDHNFSDPRYEELYEFKPQFWQPKPAAPAKPLKEQP